jgi:hypothetical protein
MKALPQPWNAAMEATMFTGWIYDHLKPQAAVLKVAHPLMPRAVVAAKKKNDRIDARKICDCLRCDFLPECYMAPTAIRDGAARSVIATCWSARWADEKQDQHATESGPGAIWLVVARPDRLCSGKTPPRWRK